MTRNSLIRWGALLVMASGVLFLAGPVFFALHFLPALSGRDQPVLYALFGVSSVAALLLVPAGMVGFHALQRHAYGHEGRAGFWLVVAGSLAVVVGGLVFFTLGQAGDFLQASPPLVWVVLGLLGLVGGLVALVAGFARYGIATLRAEVLPRWCGVAFVAALPAALAYGVFGIFLGFPWAFFSQPVVFGLIWLALGYALWTQRGVATERRP